MVEDVLIHVDKFYYPVDFVVLETEPVAIGTNHVPIIIGRPFLATSNAMINFRNGVMQLIFGNMTLELNIFHLSKKHMHQREDDSEEVCAIEAILAEQADELLVQDVLSRELVDSDEDQQELQEVSLLHGRWRRKAEILPLDLKPLPSELKYAFLGGKMHCPVVISSLLSNP